MKKFKELKENELTAITGGSFVGYYLGRFLASATHYYGKTVTKGHMHSSTINN
ncbi:bacteriocin [Lactiplantibacillus paraplantarum]|nr:bacteriocin [Lactiplantibacillus paraplantarum]AAL77872.1 Leucocin K [Lactiplantibacillus paraplantarum]AFM80177.1 leucocin K [Lactiplantibacillus paraplantarum]ERL43682.1 Leucocin K [Lactiplantibacillus paraplantarum]MCU4682578.1 bacteriocin [Lactiplantibacillus paraplantarum]MDL2060659.1 bacteriocin [Lactiplantibacillus paraplantarum]